MAFKRALVVDDSKLARVALKKLLDEHDIDVAFAETGEQALDFLDRESVDVVFMDHHMPGMDGLEAVAAIKKNPRTATIPVMMYTTREGEVYVSQARALGAVGVLPKQVQPGVLFDMLLELGLVKERRAPEDQQPSPAELQASYDVDRRLNDQAVGISVQSIVTRILEDQHLSLRADILRGNREFARQVASEILKEQSAETLSGEAAEPIEPEVTTRAYSQGTVTFLVLLLLVAALILGGLYLQAAEERDAARAELARLDQQLAERLTVAESVTSDLLVGMNTERKTTQDAQLAALAWSLGEGGSHAFERPAFDEARVAQLQTLLGHMDALGFKGTVEIASHLGEFCLNADRLGELTPAPPELAVEACATIGHPLDGSSFVSERETDEFAEFMENRRPNENGITLQLIAHDRFSSSRKYPYPDTSTTAGEWNRIAARNHRVEFTFLAEPD